MPLFDNHRRDGPRLGIAGQSLASVICYSESARSSTQKRRMPSGQWRHGILDEENETLAPKSWSSKCCYFSWKYWWSAERGEAFFRNKASVSNFEHIKAVKDAGKDAKQTRCTTFVENSELSKFDFNVSEAFSFGYTTSAPFQETVS